MTEKQTLYILHKMVYNEDDICGYIEFVTTDKKRAERRRAKLEATRGFGARIFECVEGKRYSHLTSVEYV